MLIYVVGIGYLFVAIVGVIEIVSIYKKLEELEKKVYIDNALLNKEIKDLMEDKDG